MHKHITSLVSSITLSVLIASPVFAQTPVDTSAQDTQDLVMSCRDTNAPVYQSALNDAILTMQGSIVDEWKHQVGFRLKAARSTRRAITQRALAQAGTQLDAAIAQFSNAQTDGLTRDVNAAIDSYVRLDDRAEQDALARWSDRDVSFQGLNAALARAERSLRTYASARDRAVLSTIWNATRKQAEGSFTQSRDNARQQFVQDMDDCVAGVKADTYYDTPSADSPSTDTKSPDAATNQKGAPTKQTGFAVTGINIDTASDYMSACSQKITARARIQANGPGRTTGYFVYQDGTTSPEATADTDASGGAYVQDQRTFSASSASPSGGWVKFVITRPNNFVSDRAEFKIQCQNATNQQPNNTPASTTKDTVGSSSQGAQVLEAQLARNGSGPVVGCGEQTIQYTGYVRLSQPGASFTYHFERSDAVRTSDQVATTNAYGAANVSYNWTIGQPMYGWVKLVITSPAFPDSPSLATDFTYTAGASCGMSSPNKPDASTPPAPPASPKIAASVGIVGKSDASVCGAYQFQFQGSITTDSAGKISYRWERSDGASSPMQTIAADKAGTYTASDFWDLAGMNYSGWMRLHVLSPSDTSSNQANFALTQACK